MSFWQLNPMTAEELQQQKLRELLIEVPTTVAEMKLFLSPENLAENHLPFPASDFNLSCGQFPCEAISSASYNQEEHKIYLDLHPGFIDTSVVSVSRDEVSLSEWLGLWLCLIAN